MFAWHSSGRLIPAGTGLGCYKHIELDVDHPLEEGVVEQHEIEDAEAQTTSA